jgi:hypothetical protein
VWLDQPTVGAARPHRQRRIEPTHTIAQPDGSGGQRRQQCFWFAVCVGEFRSARAI